jgi:hypothetical protein
MYPPKLTFLVQFSGVTNRVHAPLIGRAEHIDSGKTFHFNSWEELERFVKKVMMQKGSSDPQQ